MLVYSKGTVDPDLYYRVWDGEQWSAEENFDLGESAAVDLIRMVSMPDPYDEIALVAVNLEPTAFAKIWYENSWDNTENWDNGANWQGPIQTKKITKMSKPAIFTYQVPTSTTTTH